MHTFTTENTETRTKFAQLEEVVRFQAKQLHSEMASTVRRMIMQHEKKVNSQNEITPESLNELVGAIKMKASHEDVTQMHSSKANKVDVEMCFRWVDLLHKMMNQVMLLTTLKFKSDLELVGAESAHMRQNRKVQMLNQSLIIQKWVESFDS